MHFHRCLVQSCAIRSLFRHSSSFSKNIPIVKVLSTKEEDTIKLSFKFSNSTKLHLKAPKDESVEMVLSRIKLMAELQLKKEELRQTVINKYTNPLATVIPAVNNDEINVCLIQNDEFLDVSISNSDAWTQASGLKIGDVLYEVKFNTPTVTSLQLPDYIVAGCIIRPHFILECANLSDCKFTWYRSLSESCANALICDGKKNNVWIEDGKYWLKVGEGFTYGTTREDTGCFLKVVCTPGLNDEMGPDYSAESKIVEASPEFFPFQERQKCTQTFCDDDRIRCLTYNVLANIYVEKRKFPYASDKARDIYYRKQILLKELEGYKSDVLCLQEVQERMFEHDLVPVLTQLGYVGFYTRKGGHRHEGLATFIRTSKFRVTRSYGRQLNQIVKDKYINNTDLLNKVSGNFKNMSKLLAQDTALQVLLLEHVDLPQYKLIVANTHLYSNKDNPEVRLLQAAICTNYVEHLVERKDLHSWPILFCGDFNSLPQSTTYDFMLTGNYECCSSWNNSSDIGIDTVLKHNLCLGSACGTPDYTNYTHDFKGCLDYIFYAKELLKVTEVVPMPRHEDVIAHVGLPNELFPSDHIPLICTLQRKNS